MRIIIHVIYSTVLQYKKGYFQISLITVSEWSDDKRKYVSRVFKQLYVDHDDVREIAKIYVRDLLDISDFREEAERSESKTMSLLYSDLTVTKDFPTSHRLQINRLI